MPNEIKFFFDEQFYNLRPETYEVLADRLYRQTFSSLLPSLHEGDEKILEYAKSWDMTVFETRDFFAVTNELRRDLGNEDFVKMVQANILVAMPLMARSMLYERDRTEEFQAKLLMGSQFVVPVASGLYALQVGGMEAMMWTGGLTTAGIFIAGWPVAWLAGKAGMICSKTSLRLFNTII